MRVCSNFIDLHETQFSQHQFAEETLFSIVQSCSLVKDSLTIGVCSYFWVLCSVPLIHVSVFMLMPCCSDHCSFVVVSEAWESYTSWFVLFPLDCFGNSESSGVPYKFQDWFVLVLWKRSWIILIAVTFNLQIALGSMAMLTVLILTNQEYGLALHLLDASSVSLSVCYSSQHIGLSPPWLGLFQLCFSWFYVIFDNFKWDFFLFKKLLLIYFWLCQVFVAVRGIPLVVASRGYSGCVHGLLWWLLLLQSRGSRECRLQQLLLMGSLVHAQQLWRMGLVAPQHMEPSQTRDQTSAA